VNLRKLMGHFLMEAGDGGAGGGAGGGTPPGGNGGGGTLPPGGGGSGVPDFSSLIPQEFKEHPSLKDIKDMNGLVKSYIHAQSMVGADKVVIPKEGAKPEEIDAFYNKLGRPKTAQEYNLEKLQLPEGFQEQDDQLVRNFAHSLGLNNKQANDLNKFLLKTATEAMEEQKTAAATAYKAAETELRKDWGSEFDTNMIKARLAINTFGGQELKDNLEKLGLQDNPLLAKAFAKIGKALSEDQAFHSAGMREGFAPGVDSAKMEISKLNLDSEFQKAYVQLDHPGHKEAVERMNRLYSTAYPTASS